MSHTQGQCATITLSPLSLFSPCAFTWDKKQVTYYYFTMSINIVVVVSLYVLKNKGEYKYLLLVKWHNDSNVQDDDSLERERMYHLP